eukprot:scaffold3612_cov395-Prasinococcus_capsulatus_cf.AAC.1
MAPRRALFDPCGQAVHGVRQEPLHAFHSCTPWTCPPAGPSQAAGSSQAATPPRPLPLARPPSKRHPVPHRADLRMRG